MTNDRAAMTSNETGSAAANIADALASVVLELAPGSRIPSEAQLAEEHGVSRVTMREAVKIVAGRGLLELARGRRAIVRQPDAAGLGHFMSSIVRNDPEGMLQLVEARMSIEVQCAGLAALRAVADDIAEMAEALGEMRDAAAQTRLQADEFEARFHAADVRFHKAVAKASQNGILIGILSAMVPALQRSFFMSRKGRDLQGQTSEYTIHAHQRILDYIEAHDQPGAEAAMRVHITDARRDMRTAVFGRPAEAGSGALNSA